MYVCMYEMQLLVPPVFMPALPKMHRALERLHRKSDPEPPQHPQDADQALCVPGTSSERIADEGFGMGKGNGDGGCGSGSVPEFGI